MSIRSCLRGAALAGLLAAGATTAQFVAASPVLAADYFNGFESNTNDWVGDIARVPSGTHGIASRTGQFHAEATGGGAPGSANDTVFTRWGGFESVFPTAGYVTSVDIYLDFPPAASSAGLLNDMRFDWSSAINRPDGNHRRDFVFNVGYYNDAAPPGTGPRYVISASTNATRSSAFPKNPGRDPFVITQEGWYTFQHKFENVAGVLVVTLTIKNAAGVALHSWVLSDPTDIIGTTVGGNRYGWIVINEFGFLAIDNARKDESGSQSVDHFACYDVQDKQPKFARQSVALEDEFGSSNVQLKKPEYVCAPVDKNGEGIHFPDFHLVCFDADKGNDPKADVRMENQLGEQTLTVRKLKVVCVPSTKTPLQ